MDALFSSPVSPQEETEDLCIGFQALKSDPGRPSLETVFKELAKLERKTARETLNRNQRAAADASYSSGLIYPDKHPQERLYSILPFIAQHGPGLVDTLYENIHLDCPDHKVLVV